MKTLDLLNALREKYGSDYAAAPVIGVTRSAMSHYRHKGVAFGDEVAMKVAAALDLPPGAVLAAMAAERTDSPDAKRVLTALVAMLTKGSKKVAGLVMGAALAASMGFAPPVPAANDANFASSIYIMRQRRRGRGQGHSARDRHRKTHSARLAHARRALADLFPFTSRAS